jgi:hypothetical protein
LLLNYPLESTKLLHVCAVQNGKFKRKSVDRTANGGKARVRQLLNRCYCMAWQMYGIFSENKKIKPHLKAVSRDVSGQLTRKIQQNNQHTEAARVLKNPPPEGAAAGAAWAGAAGAAGLAAGLGAGAEAGLGAGAGVEGRPNGLLLVAVAAGLEDPPERRGMVVFSERVVESVKFAQKKSVFVLRGPRASALLVLPRSQDLRLVSVMPGKHAGSNGSFVACCVELVWLSSIFPNPK